MSQDTRNPLSIYTGQRNQLRLVTLSHGIIRPNLVDSFNFTPKISVKEVPEFDNPVNALIYSTFDGGTGKIGYMESNQGQINAALMDLDPTVAPQMLNAAFFQNFQTFMNLKGQDGKIKGSMLLYNCVPGAVPFDQAVKDAAKRGIDFTCLNGVQFQGLAMLYTRAVGTGVAQITPGQPTLVAATTAGLLRGGDTIYVRITAVTAAGETNGSNEAAVHIASGTDTNKVTVTTPAIVSPVLSYNVYASNRSNGERLIANVASGTTYVITGLAAATAAPCPNANTSGSYQCANPPDKIFAGAGPYTITFDIAAYGLAQTGLDYVMVVRDGVIVATVDNPATIDTFLISADGATFSVNEDPANHVWEIYTLYQP